MKTKWVLTLVLIMSSLILSVDAKGPNQKQQGALTDQEIENLIYLREEEKLARDVYLVMLDLWGEEIFANISESEQRHMDAVGRLIDKYDLNDPIVDDSIGAYTNPEFTELFTQLVEAGSESLEAALEVGVQIEELDIADIEQMLTETDHRDVQNVLENLLAGSNNHLDAFNSYLPEE